MDERPCKSVNVENWQGKCEKRDKNLLDSSSLVLVRWPSAAPAAKTPETRKVAHGEAWQSLLGYVKELSKLDDPAKYWHHVHA